MPIQKVARASIRKRAFNRVARGRAKRFVRKAGSLIRNGEDAQEAVKQAVRALDKAAQKGSLHPNNAARRKSRLMRKLNQAKGATASQQEPRRKPVRHKPLDKGAGTG